jgi:hypothetical protein
MLGLLLVGLALFGRTCADGVSDFIMSFSPPPGAAPADGTGELRRLSDDEIRARYPSLLAPDAGPSEQRDAAPRSDAGR